MGSRVGAEGRDSRSELGLGKRGHEWGMGRLNKHLLKGGKTVVLFPSQNVFGEGAWEQG